MSKIEWTEKTWNPTVGCTKISPGCKHCYAEKMHARLRSIGVEGYEDPFSQVHTVYDRMTLPLARKKPTLYFVNSMSDLFHEDVGLFAINSVFKTISASKRHTYQILTKRADRLLEYALTHEIPDNAWIGVSVEDQKYGKPRIDILRQVPCKTRFLSIEPLLEHLGDLDLTGIHWVIVGGESGSHARRMYIKWVDSIRRRCEEQQVPLFFKQWGTWGADGKKRSKAANGHELLGKTYRQYPSEMIIRRANDN